MCFCPACLNLTSSSAPTEKRQDNGRVYFVNHNTRTTQGEGENNEVLGGREGLKEMEGKRGERGEGIRTDG